MSDDDLDDRERWAREGFKVGTLSMWWRDDIIALIAEVRRLRACQSPADNPGTAYTALQYDGFVDPPARHSPPGAASM